MAFYDLPKSSRTALVAEINDRLHAAFLSGNPGSIIPLLDDRDTYIRKAAYTETGKLYFAHQDVQQAILACLHLLVNHPSFYVRQTIINAAGEIGKKDFAVVVPFFDHGLFDAHHSPRNAVIGSIKKMGEKNPVPVLDWARKYLHHPDKEIRREICHGIELRGRTHPQDILPLLRELQFDKVSRVRKTLVHVIGQIAYKRGCLATVVEELLTWENQQLVAEAWIEILIIHDRYHNFTAQTTTQAKAYIEATIGATIGYAPEY